MDVAERAQQNFDHPSSLDTPLLYQHLIKLRQGKAVKVPTYDYVTHTRNADIFEDALPKPIIIVEGILLLSDLDLCGLFDVKIFVDTEDDIRLIRRIQRDTVERKRDLAGIMKQYLSTVRPMHVAFVQPSRINADVIVPKGVNSVAIDLVVSRIRGFLDEL
jgi:uridine kinase